mmetsp:Transcript_12690/g.24720  ORF Transcript_12690/g.24720 Transcript_12690/m.24720 type:complete len:81 (+) Transcript_12690:2548-2790(+)
MNQASIWQTFTRIHKHTSILQVEVKRQNACEETDRTSDRQTKQTKKAQKRQPSQDSASLPPFFSFFDWHTVNQSGGRLVG